MRKPRLTIRLSQNQQLVLDEMVEALDTSYSLLVRTIIGSWLTQNEEYIERIIEKHRQDALDKHPEEEGKE